MRISDWSSDVCSSDLCRGDRLERVQPVDQLLHDAGVAGQVQAPVAMFDHVTDITQMTKRVALYQGMGGRNGVYGQTTGKFRPLLGRQVQPVAGQPPRSEEHTSELQSLMRISYAVFCLKKK